LLSLSAQQKLESAIRQATRKLEAEFEQRVQAGIKQALEDTVLPHYYKKVEEYDEVIKARKGVVTTEEYRLILSCLHPDQSASPDRIRKAFEVLKSHELSLRGEKEMPTAPSSMPRNYAEMMKRREEVSRTQTPEAAIQRRSTPVNGRSFPMVETAGDVKRKAISARYRWRPVNT
jgi:hypothetical protein